MFFFKFNDSNGQLCGQWSLTEEEVVKIFEIPIALYKFPIIIITRVICSIITSIIYSIITSILFVVCMPVWLQYMTPVFL